MSWLAFALAALVGLSLGLLGGGGSILTVPILVSFLGFGVKQAVTLSLVVVGVTSLVGAVSHWRAGNVDLLMAPPFGAVTTLGAFAGARIGVGLPDAVQLWGLAVVMLAAAASMVRERPAASPTDRSPARWAFLLALGLSVGLLTGIVGVGGGFLIVPALVIFARLPMKRAIGTSLVVIAVNAAAGFAGYAGHIAVPWRFAVLFIVVAIGGIVLGTRLIRYVPGLLLQRTFAALLVVLAVALFFR